MGRKKQKIHSCSNSPPPAKSDASHTGVSPTTGSADDLRQEQSKNEQIDSISCDPINIECKRALTALRLGNHTEALSIMKDVCLRHKTSAIAHCVQGDVYFILAKRTDDHVAEQEHLKNAAESMKQAVSLSPTSFKFSYFYSCVLYLMGNEMLTEEEYKKGFWNYKGLDPIEESLLKYFEMDFKLEDIESMRKNSKLKRRDGEQNAMEVRSVQTKRPNEINKAKKMLEDRRTEIEIRVAAAKLLQRSSENDEVRVFESSSGDHRLEQRRKHANTQKLASSLTRRCKVLSYWKSMSGEEKRGLLEIKICDLRVYFSSLKEILADQIFSEAIGFTEKNGTWKFWACCSCDEKFIDTESLIRHLKGEHVGNLAQELQSVVPIAINANSFEKFLNIPWKPVDIPATKRFFESKFRSKLDNPSEEDHPQPTEGNEDCPVDNRKLPVDNRKLSWSNDSERGEILQEIRGIFLRLLRHEYLAQSHFRKVIECTMKELQTFVPLSLLRNTDLYKTPLCICLLGASQLKNVLNFLQEMAHACGLNRYSEKGSSTDDALNDNQGYEIKEKIVLTTDSSCLLLDEHLLHRGYGDADSSATTTAVGDHEVGMLRDTDTFVHWLFSDPSIGEELASWTSLQDNAKYQGIEVLQVLKKEFHLLRSLCERKSEHLRHEGALQVIESIYCEELGNRLPSAKYIPQSYGTLLRKRQEELVKSDDDAVSTSSKVVLEVISNILDEAQPASVKLDVKSNILEEVQAINVNHFRGEETLIDVASSLGNQKCSENIEYRMPDYLHLEEDRIKVAVQRQKAQLSAELGEIDARILRIVADMKQLQLKFALVSAHDYRAIVFPLLKSFMLAYLEDRVDKDATEKSDAAREAFLTELALDARKNINKGGNQTKHKQQKLKDKKKNKNKRKPKFSKDISVNKEHVLLLRDVEQVHGDHPNYEGGISKSPNELKGQKEEFGRKIDMLHQEDAEEAQIPVSYEGDHLNSESGISVSANELEGQKEELGHKIDVLIPEDAEEDPFLVACDGKHPNSASGISVSTNELKGQKGELGHKIDVLHPEDEEQSPFLVACDGKHPNSESGISVSANELKGQKGELGHKIDVLHPEDEEQSQFPAAYEGDHLISESGISVRANELKEQEEEHRLKTELELEERKAEEILDYERQIDNEAKLQQLAEQNKKVCGTIPAKLAERIPLVSFGREPVKPGKKVTVVYFGRIPVQVRETVPIVYSKPSDAGGPVTHSGVRYSDGWKSTDVSCSHPNQYVELDDPDVSQMTPIRHTMIMRSEGQTHRPDKDAPPPPADATGPPEKDAPPSPPPPPPPADATGPLMAVGASTSASQPIPSTSAPPQRPWTIQTGFTQVMEQIASLRAYVDQGMTTLDQRMTTLDQRMTSQDRHLHDLQDLIDTLFRVAQFNPYSSFYDPYGEVDTGTVGHGCDEIHEEDTTEETESQGRSK